MQNATDGRLATDVLKAKKKKKKQQQQQQEEEDGKSITFHQLQ